MSKEKDLLAEIEHQETVIAEATERLKALRVEVYALRCEARRNKKLTPAMLDVLAKLAAGDALFDAFYDEIDALYDEFEAFYNEIDALYDEDESARETQFSVVSWSRFLVTLTPVQVAEAAEKALRGMNAEQGVN